MDVQLFGQQRFQRLPGFIGQQTFRQHILLQLDFAEFPRLGNGQAGGGDVKRCFLSLDGTQEGGDFIRAAQDYRGKLRLFFVRFGGSFRAGSHFAQPFGDAVQLVLAQGGQAFRHMRNIKRVQIKCNRRGGPDGGQVFAERSQFCVVPHLFSQLALDLISMSQHVFQRAVFIQQLDGGFFAHAGNAGNVVAGVAHQALPVRYLFGGNAEGFLHARGIEQRAFRDALAGEQHLRPVADQLQRVPVASEQHAVQPVFTTFSGQRAQNVVSLIAFAGQHAQLHVAQYFLDQRELRPQFLRHGAAACLVIRVSGVAERGRGQVKGDGNIPRRHLLHGFEQHRQKTMGRVGIHAIRVQQRHGVKSPVHQAVSVHGQQRFPHNNHLVSRSQARREYRI